MQIKFKGIFIIVLSAVSFAVSADKHNTEIVSLIQNNLKDAVLYMSREGGYEVKSFGNIATVYSDTPGPDYNMIFDLPAEKSNQADLKQALSYSKNKRYQFMLVREQHQANSEVDAIIANFNYQKVGVATRMAITHAAVNFNKVDTATIRQVDNEQLLDEFCLLTDEAYDRAPGSSKDFMSAMQNLFQPESELKLYLAYDNVDGMLKPVGTAMLYLPKDKDLLAGHYGWTVRGTHRKRGIMTNLAKNMVLIAKNQGYSASVAQCYDDSVRLAEKIGFKKYGDLELYVNKTTAR